MLCYTLSMIWGQPNRKRTWRTPCLDSFLFDESWNGCDLEMVKRFQPHLDTWKFKYRQICSQNRYPNFEIMTRFRFLKEFELRFSKKEIWRKSSCQDHIYFIRIQDGFIVYDSPLDFKDSQGFKNTWGLWTVRDSVFPVFQVAMF